MVEYLEEGCNMYLVRSINEEEKEYITITDYCNTGNDYKPKVVFNLTYSDSGFHIHFDVYESNPRANYTENFSPVCRDSCVEWFINFDPAICDRYFNFEVNPNGAMDLSFRLSRNEYVDTTNEDIKSLNIVTDIKDGVWTVDYVVPFDFIKKYIKGYEFKTGTVMKANVYKCGDDTEFEHCGCWGMVDRDAPDFHTPQFFKEMKIV